MDVCPVCEAELAGYESVCPLCKKRIGGRPGDDLRVFMLKFGLVISIIDLIVSTIRIIGMFATGQVFLLLASVFHVLFMVGVCFLFLTGIDYINHRGMARKSTAPAEKGEG
jgi:hypothetical protein